MRQVGIIPDEAQARTLADYLFAQGITCRIETRPAGCEIWVHDEEFVARAATEVSEFLANALDPKYEAARVEAQKVREKQLQQERDYRRNVVDLRHRWAPASERRPLTLILIGLSILAAVASQFGEVQEPVLDALTITHVRLDTAMLYWTGGLPEIRSGQVWRLFTPMLLHFSVPHLVFNMLALFYMGGQIEGRRGTWFLLLLVLLLSAVSNLCQYMAVSPYFGGMSGVVYGLFGYIWIRSRRDPECGYMLDDRNIVIMLAWFFLCMTGLVGSIANWAHGGGLILGMILGYLSSALRRRKARK